MQQMLADLRGSSREQDGASAVEYGLLVAGIAGLIVLIVFALGGQIGNLFGNSCGTIRSQIEHNSCA